MEEKFFPDYLLEYIDPKKIDLGNYETSDLGVILKNGIILLNKNDSEERQIIVLLHEILHMHPRFMSYTGGLWHGTFERDENIESEITRLAERVYESRPDIVSFVKKRLNEAKKHPLNLRD